MHALILFLLLLVPNPPTELTASVNEIGTTTAFDLAWTDNSDNESGFEIYRVRETSAPTPTIVIELIGEVGVDVESFTDTKAPGSGYFGYFVVAFNSEGNSLPSNQVDIYIEPPKR